MKMQSILFGLLFLIVAQYSVAQNILVLKENDGYEVTHTYFSALRDSSHSLNVMKAYSGKFQVPENYYTLPVNDRSAFWFKVELIDSSSAERDWYFTCYKYTIDSIEFYVFYNDSLIKSDYYSVHTTKMSDREMEYKNFSFDLSVPKNKKVTILFKTDNRHASYFGYAVKEHQYYISYAVQESFYFGLFYGGICLIIIYHLSFLWSLRDRAYLFYVLYILFQGLYMTFRDGVVQPAIFPEVPQLVRPSFAIVTIFLSVSLLLYARFFLKLNNYKVFDLIIKIYIPVRVLGYLIEPSHNVYHLMLDYTAVLIAFVFSMFSLFQKHQTSYLLCIGFTFLIAAHTINSLWQNNIIECTPPVFYSMYVGLMIESVLLALANAFRLNMLKKDSIKKLELENLRIKDELQISQQQSIILDQKEQIENFLYRASHDIKGPLKTIDGLSRLGLMDDKDSTQYFSRIQIMTTRLQKIVDNFLEVVKNNNSSLRNEKVNLHALIRQCLEEQFSEYPGRELIEISIEVPLRLEILSEYYSIYSVIQNLIENAIKYQDPSKNDKYIRISATRKIDHIELTVEDNGQGINESSREKIFSMFYRANTGNAEGVGMGLYIVKQALDRINAKISIESEEGKYSRFIIRLKE